MSVQTRTRRGWVVPAAVASAAVVASLAMGTLGAYSASITGEDNLAGTGNLTMTETLLAADGSLTDTVIDSFTGTDNAVVNSDINRYGVDGAFGGEGEVTDHEQLVPGTEVSTSVRIANTGSVPGALTLAFGQVTADGEDAPAPALADVLELELSTSLTEGEVTVLETQTLNAWSVDDSVLTDITLGENETQDFTFTIRLPETADNTVMDQTVFQDLTWTLSAEAAEA